jgi:17 kDa outer membrane surface antigen
MLMKFFFKVAAALFFSAIALTVYASNHSFLGNSAMSFFSKEDWKLSKTAQDEALNQLKDGARLAWKNPKTGSHGIFLPMHTIHANGSVCRDMQIIHSANLVNDKATYRFCKLNNQWKIV